MTAKEGVTFGKVYVRMCVRLNVTQKIMCVCVIAINLNHIICVSVSAGSCGMQEMPHLSFRTSIRTYAQVDEYSSMTQQGCVTMLEKKQKRNRGQNYMLLTQPTVQSPRLFIYYHI